MIDVHDTPNGWSLGAEIIASLSTTPALISDLAADFGITPREVVAELNNSAVPLLRGKIGLSVAVRINPAAWPDAKQKSMAYWSQVHEPSAVAA